MSEEIKKKMLLVSAILFKNNVPVNEAKEIGSFIEQLQQENQQLKFQLEYEKENLMFSKDYAKCLEEKRDKYKSVLDEIREVIIELRNIIYNPDYENFGLSREQYKDRFIHIFEILDKVKE